MAQSIRESIMINLLSIVQKNNGQFKSEKQSAFIRSQCHGDQFIIVQRYTFGEHNGCVQRVEYVFDVNEQGVTKATKNGQQFFPMTDEVEEQQKEVAAQKRKAAKSAKMDKAEKAVKFWKAYCKNMAATHEQIMERKSAIIHHIKSSGITQKQAEKLFSDNF